MRNKRTRFVGIGLVIFICMQFFIPSENHLEIFENNDSKILGVPNNTLTILKASCFNCHSNYTNYPWYTRIQPVRWWITGHIKDGKSKLNFSKFETYDVNLRYELFKKIENAVKNGVMPLPSYLTTHPESRLTNDQKDVLINWAKATQNSMKVKFPSEPFNLIVQ